MNAKKTKLLRKYAKSMNPDRKFFKIMKKAYNSMDLENRKEAVEEASRKVKGYKH